MQLSDLKTDLLDECNKGTALSTSALENRIQRAVRFIETSHDWYFMQKFDTDTFNTADANPRRLSQPTNLRAVHLLRIQKSDGTYQKIVKAQPQNVKEHKTALPNIYWSDGADYWWFDNTPAENYTLERFYEQLTTWDNSDTFEPWLFKYADSLVFHQTMLFLAPYLREPDLMEMHKPLRDEALEAAKIVDHEHKYSDQEMRMGYGHDTST